MITAALTPDARALASALIEAGFCAVLVGGAVRDKLLASRSAQQHGAQPPAHRKSTPDLDFVTDARPDDVRRIANGASWARAVYAVGERFGTVGVALADGRAVEITRFRPEACAQRDTAARFAVDAGYRDFTVNAMGIDLAMDSLLDPLGGARDLAAGILRAPGDPHARFCEDPVRVLRAGRFVSELGFALEPATRAALDVASPALANVSVERIRDELAKLLTGSHVSTALRLLLACGALAVVLPEVAALDGMSQPSFHDLDVFAHTVQAVGLAPATPVLRWGTLLHDVGKVPTRTVEADGRIRFYKHASTGAAMAQEICRRLKFSNADTAAIVHLVAQHMRLGELETDNPRAVDRAVRKLDLWVPGSKPPRLLATAEDALSLMLADLAATAHRDEVPDIAARIGQALQESRSRGTRAAMVMPLTNAELMSELDLAPGPAVGVARKAIAAAIESGALQPADRKGALRAARRAVRYYLTHTHNTRKKEDES